MKKTLEETKNSLVKILKSLEYDTDTTQALVDFVETYDGTNVDKFTAAIMQMIVMMMYLQKLEVKGQAYDELSQSNDTFRTAFNDIKSDYERINAGKEPEQPSQAS